MIITRIIGPVSCTLLGKEGDRTMIPKDLLEDYLIDQEDGLKKLLTWFLNLVMQLVHYNINLVSLDNAYSAFLLPYFY